MHFNTVVKSTEHVSDYVQAGNQQQTVHFGTTHHTHALCARSFLELEGQFVHASAPALL